jgi:prevent-host-death family protein
MESIPHRELRNNSSAVLARVAAGESLLVTNHGDPAAVLVPPASSVLERLVQGGSVRPARVPRTRFSQLRRATGASSEKILDDLRGDR